MRPQSLIALLLVGIALPALAGTARKEPTCLIILGQPSEISRYYPVQPAGSRRTVGFGITLYTLLTPAPILRKQVADALDQAEATGYPVLIHADDWNYTPAEWTDPEMIEWSAFPAPGTRTGPIVRRRWLNWGTWMALGPPPNYESPRFRAYVSERLGACVAAPIAERLRRWRREGRTHLFAGLVVGWESGYYTASSVDLKDRPKAGVERFGDDERVDSGFAALTARGYSAARLERETAASGRSSAEQVRTLMARVVRDYAAWSCGLARRAGLPPERIYTHCTPSITRAEMAAGPVDGRLLPLETAANRASRVGYTMTAPWHDFGKVTAGLRRMRRSVWGAVEVEFTDENRSEPAALAYLNRLEGAGARLICVYGWWERPDHIFGVRGTGAAAAMGRWLAEARPTGEGKPSGRTKREGSGIR